MKKNKTIVTEGQRFINNLTEKRDKIGLLRDQLRDEVEGLRAMVAEAEDIVNECENADSCLETALNEIGTAIDDISLYT